MPRPRRSLLAATALAALAASAPASAGEPPAPPGTAAEEVVVLDTTMGRMVLELLPEVAPQTVASFRRLVEAGFYDGLRFYRVVAGHVAQAGDGGENDRPKVPGEFGGPPHETGVVGLARDEDPDSGSTEFYITLAPRHHLDGRYAVFGRVVEGLDVLERIGAVEVTEKWVGDESPVAFHEPKTPIVIERARIERRPVVMRAPEPPGLPHSAPESIAAPPAADDGEAAPETDPSAGPDPDGSGEPPDPGRAGEGR